MTQWEEIRAQRVAQNPEIGKALEQMRDINADPPPATVENIIRELAYNFNPQGIVLWLMNAKPYLDGASPASLMDTPEGRERILSQAIGISEGVFT